MKLNREGIKQLEEFEYQGVVISVDEGTGEGVTHRVHEERKIWEKLGTLLKENKSILRNKKGLFIGLEIIAGF